MPDKPEIKSKRGRKKSEEILNPNPSSELYFKSKEIQKLEQAGELNIDQRIEELKRALDRVEKEFKATRRALLKQINNWIVLCVLSILVCGILSYLLLNITFDKDWTWQYIYYTSIRIVIAGVVISLLTFMFKMLRSYIHLFEQIRHKITLVRSMAYLVGAGTSPQQRDIIYYVLTEKLVQLGDIGILSKEGDFKNDNSNIMDILEKLIKTKN